MPHRSRGGNLIPFLHGFCSFIKSTEKNKKENCSWPLFANKAAKSKYYVTVRHSKVIISLKVVCGCGWFCVRIIIFRLPHHAIIKGWPLNPQIC